MYSLMSVINTVEFWPFLNILLHKVDKDFLDFPKFPQISNAFLGQTKPLQALAIPPLNS